eukprot:2199890-Alexandrium_andersonii.AAC.1
MFVYCGRAGTVRCGDTSRLDSSPHRSRNTHIPPSVPSKCAVNVFPGIHAEAVHSRVHVLPSRPPSCEAASHCPWLRRLLESPTLGGSRLPS